MVSKSILAAAPLGLLLVLGACTTPVGPVEVTRFLAPETVAQLGRGTIAIESAPGSDWDSLQLRSYEAAVRAELARLGYTEAPAATADQIAQVRFGRQTFRSDGGGRGPVSVGVGGSTGGGWGSGVGVGIGINLSGKPPEMTATDLGVTIRNRATGAPMWEGRASFSVKASSPLADTQLSAAKMASAMFAGFPGQSGETIEVK